MENNGLFPPDRPTMLFVDDRTKRIHWAFEQLNKVYDITIATNVLEALRQLSEKDFDFVSLDHDLGGKDFVEIGSENSAMRILEYMTNSGWPFKKKPYFFVHSSNVFAANSMMDVLMRNRIHYSKKSIDYRTIEVKGDW